MKELVEIQRKLKAPKGQYNSFGRYKYRSCEDILEAVKPLLYECKLTLTITDEIVEIGGRIYVKATATLLGGDGSSISTSAYAREAEKKSGMDDSQITGAASSYARKYAMNGLFCIDDTRDADSLNVSKSFTDNGLEDAIEYLLTSSTDRQSFEEAMRRHSAYLKYKKFKDVCAEIAKKYPKESK